MSLQQELSDDLYQKIAAEMNLSETVYITKINSSDSFTTGQTTVIFSQGIYHCTDELAACLGCTPPSL